MRAAATSTSQDPPTALRDQHDLLNRPEFSTAQWFSQLQSGRILRPSGIEPIALIAVYIDTLHIFLRSIADDDRERLAAAHAKDPRARDRKWWLEDVKIENKKGDATVIGYKVIAQHPQPNLLRKLASIMREQRGFNSNTTGSITRLDFAVDFLPLNGHTRAEVDSWLFAHLIMPKRRAAPLWRYENSTYWNKGAHENQNSRDLVHYSDKPSKLPILGPQPITHLDPRFRGGQTLQRLGIDTLITDVMSADPARIIRKAFYFTSTDIRPHAEAEVGQYRFLDYAIRRRQFHSAQRVKERLHVAMPVDPTPPLLIVPKLLFL